MKTALALLLVLFAARPALGSEFMTNNVTLVYEKPNRKSKVVAEIPVNVKISSDERKDYWFHVTVRLDDENISGWVNQTDVTDLMGRSKGQLLAENNRLYDELVALRRAVKELGAGLGSAMEEKAALEEQLQAAREEAEAASDGPDAAAQEPAPPAAELRKAREDNARLAEELERTRAALADAEAENERLSDMLERLREDWEDADDEDD